LPEFALLIVELRVKCYTSIVDTKGQKLYNKLQPFVDAKLEALAKEITKEFPDVTKVVWK
jgi:hypothetical protein